MAARTALMGTSKCFACFSGVPLIRNSLGTVLTYAIRHGPSVKTKGRNVWINSPRNTLPTQRRGFLSFKYAPLSKTRFTTIIHWYTTCTSIMPHLHLLNPYNVLHNLNWSLFGRCVMMIAVAEEAIDASSSSIRSHGGVVENTCYFTVEPSAGQAYEA